MAGGTYTIYVTVDASGAVTGLRSVDAQLTSTAVKAKETQTVFAGMFKFFALSAVVHELYEAGEGFLKVKSDMQVAGYAADNMYRAFDSLLTVANNTRQPIEQLSDLFRQLAIYSGDLGLETQDLFDITESFAKALTLGGASAQRASNGTIQFAHAIEQAKVQGQQFNALLKDNPVFLRAIAQALNTNISGLKAMQLSGELTGQKLAEASVKAKKFVDEIFKLTVPTLGQAFVILKNNVVAAVADMDRLTGGFSLLAGTLVAVATGFRQIAPILVNLALTLGAVRLALMLYTITANTGALATTLFGKAILGAQGQLLTARVAFGGIATVLVLVGTVLLQFGDKIKVGIGPIKNMRDAMLALMAALQFLVVRVIGAGPALTLLIGLFATLRLRLGAVGVIITLTVAVLQRLHATFTQSAITLGIVGTALLLLGVRFTFFKTAVTGLTTMWINLKLIAGGLVPVLLLLRNAFVAVFIAETAMGAPLAAIAIGIAAVTLAIYGLIQSIPGLESFANWIDKILGFAWGKLVEWLSKIAKWVGNIGEELGDTVKQMIDLGDSSNEAGGEIERMANEAAKLNQETAAAAKNLDDISKSASTSGSSSGGSSGAGGSINVSISSSAGSVAVAMNGGTASAGSATQTNTTNNGGSGGGGGGGSSGSSSGAGGGGQFEIAVRTPGPVVAAPGGGYKQGPDYYAPGATPIGSDPSAIYDARNQIIQDQLTRLNAIYGALVQNVQNTGKINLTNTELQILKLQTGASQQTINAVMKANQAQLLVTQKIYNLQQKAAAQAAAAQAAQALRDQQTQAVNQSIEQLTLQALNAYKVGSNSELPAQVQSLIQQISQMQGALVAITDPIQRAEQGRQVQILTDALNKLTGAVTNAANQNPYTKYAQNVYGSALGVSGTASASAPFHQGSGAPASAEWMGSFAEGGNIGIQADGLYAANLHAGESVRISKKEGSDRPVVLNMVVNGVQDTEGFRRSKKQIMTSLYRGLMAAGAQS